LKCHIIDKQANGNGQHHDVNGKGYFPAPRGLHRKKGACCEKKFQTGSNSLLDCGFVKLVFVAIFGSFIEFKLRENNHFRFIKQHPLLPYQKTDSLQFCQKALMRSVKKCRNTTKTTTAINKRTYKTHHVDDLRINRSHHQQ
jgi:hypothetical protein